MRRRTATLVLAIAIGAGLTVSVTASSSARTAAARSISRLLLAFHRAGNVGCCFQVDSRYAFLPDAQFGTLIDEITGARTQVDAPPCGGITVLGGPWLAVDCGYTPDSVPRLVWLYSLPARRWQRSVAVDPSLAHCYCVDLTGVGAHWLKFRESAYHAPNIDAFQSIDTGRVRGDPTGRFTVPDVNSTMLASRICAPLQVPLGWAFGTETPTRAFGSVQYDGRYVLVFGGPTDAQPAVYLERCGSRLHEILCPRYCQPAANAHFVVWLANYGRSLAGLSLAGRRHLRIPLPVLRSGRVYTYVALGFRTLYAVDSEGRLLTARMPSS